MSKIVREKHTQLSCRSAVVRRWRNGGWNPLLGIIRHLSMLRHSVLVSSRPSAYTHVSATGAILAKHPHLQSMAGSVEFQRRAGDGMNPRSTIWRKRGTGEELCESGARMDRFYAGNWATEVINVVVGVRWWIGSDSVYANAFEKQHHYILESS